MRKYHPDNERIKHKFFVFLKEAKRQNEASVDAAAKAISRFEQYAKYRNFKAFHFQQAVGFKAHLAKQLNVRTGKPLSKATMHSTTRALKAFFQWLALQPGYRSRINYTDTDYFNLSAKDTRVAIAKRVKRSPTLEQVKHVIAVMPHSSAIERRNRALVAFTILTGARNAAIASMKLKHVNLDESSVDQDAREVNTKGSKTVTSYFFPVGDDVLQVVQDWVQYLNEELLFGRDDPLFPRTQVKRCKSGLFEAVGLSRTHWSTATPICKIFKEAFERASLPYFNPHSFRDTLTRLGESICKSPEEFKAWSQNSSHKGVLTTFVSYGEVQHSRQSEILKELRHPPERTSIVSVDELEKMIQRVVATQPGT